MPASRSRNRNTRAPAPRKRSYAVWPPLVIGVLAALTVLIMALPASVAARFLPPGVRTEQLSGSVWHGVAGAILVDGQDVGALEWRLHPAALLHLALDVDLHWIKGGLSVDANAEIRRHGITATSIRGGGPIQDLHDLGVPPGWRGRTEVSLTKLTGDFTRITSVAGVLRVENLASPAVAGGANLGGYVLRFPETAAGGDQPITAHATDTGGPLQLQALVTVWTKERRGTVSGTVVARPGAEPALAAALEDLAQLRGRDRLGRVQMELEFSF